MLDVSIILRGLGGLIVGLVCTAATLVIVAAVVYRLTKAVIELG